MTWVTTPPWSSYTFPTVSSLETVTQVVPTTVAPVNILSGRHTFDSVPDLTTSADDTAYPIASG